MKRVTKDKQVPIKKRAGPSPAILGKGGPMVDRTKYNRKREKDRGNKEHS